MAAPFFSALSDIPDHSDGYITVNECSEIRSFLCLLRVNSPDCQPHTSLGQFFYHLVMIPVRNCGRDRPSLLNPAAPVKRTARKLIDLEAADFIASDTHDLTERACHMAECRELISRKYGENAAKRLFWDNARQILSSIHEA